MHSLRRKLPSANALFAFEAAARCGNFSKAALELYVTQPAVSRMLSRMEEHLNVKLFERAHGKVRLTEDGEILYTRISEGFRGIEAALDQIEARRTGTETITLSVSTAFTTHWLMPRMHKLRAAFPSVDLRFQLTSGPMRGPVTDVDLGLRFPHRDDLHERIDAPDRQHGVHHLAALHRGDEMIHLVQHALEPQLAGLVHHDEEKLVRMLGQPRAL